MTRSPSAGNTASAQSTDHAKSHQLGEHRSRPDHEAPCTRPVTRIATPGARPAPVEQMRDALHAAALPA
ncbi:MULTISPECIES: hypothetical protein [Burkholderia]|nr:hypothetical protein [Burkholderia cepacia]AIO26512.1 hypothetical protein DM41_7571 [Burkholderia cepacia ATCC 25416]ALK23346.1 hypothetical protein APZ15_36535 [Burkholderia cepacia ATCC 25416]MCA7895461.1 hypothetical protein [Burkholderia cepacia]MCA7939767.1 hypothetical protein [Burkholderia cepacia]MCA8470022.1 hypothetical protein [Burkholderia cepacia]